MEPIRTCVLGTGLAGLTFHVPFILALPELFSLHATLERNPKTEGGRLQERFGVAATIYTALDDVLNDKELELIVIATPNETHYEFAKRSLEAGKHGKRRSSTLYPHFPLSNLHPVLVDKPVTATVDQAKELGELAKSKNLVLYAFQNRRWDSDFLALRKLLSLAPSSPQYLGNVWEFESRYISVSQQRYSTADISFDLLRFDRYRTALKGTWKDKPLPGAGQTYDLGTHLNDQALVLFGCPESLTAFKQNTRGIGHPDVEDSVRRD
jgi:predicted dehydrogenase